MTLNSSVSVSQFKYNSPNGEIEGWRVSPMNESSHRFILFCRGGTQDFGAIENRIIQHVLSPLAKNGYTVYATQYSGGPNSQGNDAYGGSDVEDVLSLYEYMLKVEPSLKDGKLGLLCFSRGAINGCRAMQRGLPVSSAVFVSGMFDLTDMKQERPDIVALWQEKKMFPITTEELKKRSALFFSAKLPRIAYLFLHAQDDQRVNVRHSVEMSRSLDGNATLHVFEGNDHCLIKHGQQRNQLIADFFQKTL